jgi:glycerol-3-phosphate cytidylyltransferase
MKTGFVASCFDLLHAGHCLMLKDAKEQCDYLVAALQADPSADRPDKNKPVQSLEERLIQLESIKYVDEIQLYDREEDLRQLLHEIRPNVRILGSDYIGRVATGQEYSDEVYYHKRDHNWSTSELRNRIKNML